MQILLIILLVWFITFHPDLIINLINLFVDGIVKILDYFFTNAFK